MGMPSVNVSFTEKAAQVITRGQRGIVALILKDAVPSENPFTVLDITDIPGALTTANQIQIKLALIGYQNAPKKVICYVLPANAEDYTDALEYLETERFDYLAIPTVDADDMTTDVASWIKSMRQNGKKCKAVLPDCAIDDPGIINHTTENIKSTYGDFTAEGYCSRIAGLIAGTPLTISCTYAPLPEVTDCTRMSRSAMDEAVDDGEFFIFYDGEKVKVARAINSFLTTTADKGNQFKKIKIVEAMDMIYDDITKTTEDSYIGKFSNSYDNKCLLISAISGYFEQLILDGILSSASVDIDVTTQRAYIKASGVDTDDMTDQAIRVYDTDDKVFLKASITILDAIEEVVLPINI
ncbi:MAG: Phage tail sheath protein [Herbinix sp.]|jgi:hypothetical protein|nr:Phage tail sheath protein [Herbinix sp.]